MAHTEDMVVVYVNDEEKIEIKNTAKECGKSMSKYLLDLHKLNQEINKPSALLGILIKK